MLRNVLPEDGRMDSAIAVATRFTQDAVDVGVLLLDAQGALLIMDDCASGLLGLSESAASLVPSCALFSLKPLTFEQHLTHARLKGNWHFESLSTGGDTLSVKLDYNAQKSTYLVKIRRTEHIPIAEQDYRLAFDSAGTGLALLRMNGEWIAANRMLCQMLGYTEEELRATSFQRLTHPDDADVSKDDLHRLIQGQRTSLTLEKRYIRKDGSILWARLTVGVARNHDAEALYFVSQLEDISEHLALRQALLNNEKKYLLLAKNSQNIILRYNRLGQQIYANPELERARSFPNTHITERTSTADPLDEYFGTQVKLTLSTGVANTFLLESRDSYSGRSVDYLCNLTPEHHETGELCGVLVTAQDVSALRRQERAENARSAIFQKMVTNDTLIEVLPLLSTYLKILTPDFGNAMAFKAVPGDDPLRAPPVDASWIETCLAEDLDRHPELFEHPRFIADLKSDAPALAFCQPAVQAGYRGCWVEPVIDKNGIAMGAILLLVSGEAQLSEQDRKHARMASHIGAIAWERRSAHSHLAQSERRYREVFDHSQDMLCLLAVDAEQQLSCLEANPKLCEMLAKRHSDMIGQPLGQCLEKDAANIVEAICLHCIAVGAPIELDAHLPCGQRSLVVHFNLVPVADPNGRLHRLVCIARNITDIREAQRNELARQQEIGTLVENSPDGIARLSPTGELLFVNPALEAWLDRPLSDLLHRDLLEILPKNLQSQLFREAVIEAVEKGQPLEHEYALTAQHRLQRVYHISLVPEQNIQGKIATVLAVVRDISQLRLAEMRLASLNKQLRQLMSSRESAREEERKLIAQEIHDELGQHLTAIRMGTSLLRFQYAEQLPQLTEQVARLLQLIDQTVQVVRNISTSLRPSILNMGIVASLEWLTDTFRQQWGIDCNLEIHPQKICLDDASATAAFRIAQESLTNIARHADATRVNIAFEQSDNGWSLEIADNGKGFEQRDQSSKTLGLLGMRERGLTLGGTTTISSSIGSGTTVQLRVPASRSQDS
ncbi:PAS domain S-box protein [Pseudomonas corrugata]|uniref:PAS domain S-box protein n=2 Tax=Pseudomonas corrugata TaxID=47879 RepID=A0A7Y5Z1L8_9PSED|nr:PAS domain S-box protein [Pseudomonas corrugata]